MSDADIQWEDVNPPTEGVREPPREGILPQDVVECVCDDTPPPIAESRTMLPDNAGLFHEAAPTEDTLPLRLDEYIWSDDADNQSFSL
jgi:hypothetical protein